MVAKPQARTEDQTTEPTEIAALMQRIETALNTATTAQAQAQTPTPHLTEEARAALAAPLDPAYLRTRKGQGGKTFTYCDIDYLESRATEVDPDWGNPAFSPLGEYGLSCTITIRGVQRSATAGYYIGDTYWVWDSYKKESVEKPMTSEVAHTIVTRAQAAGERRAFAKHGLGAELWAHNEGEYEADRAAQDRQGPQGSGGPGGGHSSTASGNPRSGGEFRAPTEGRINLLTGFGVPADVAKLINSWGHGKGSDGYPISDVSETIKALMAKRGKNAGALARSAWEPIVQQHAPYALSASAGDTNDDFDDDEDFS